MAEIDWNGFGSDVTAALGSMSIDAAVRKWPATHKALWSRARRGLQPLSAENYLLVCSLLGLDPWRRFSDRPKPRRARRRKALSLGDIVRNQAVTVGVSRVTDGARP